MKTIDQLFEKKKHNEAIFLGCGPSINNLTKEDWKKISSLDSWCSNNFIINKNHIPDFYHLEVKLHRNGKFIKEIVERKKEQYKNVNWVLDGSRAYLLDCVNPKHFDDVFLYKRKQHRGSNGNYKPKKNLVQVSCMASLTAILDIMFHMRYDTIYFAGVDLYSSEYFWTGNDEYNDVGIPEIMKSCKPDERSKDSIHPTQERGVAEFISEFGKFNNVKFVNISPKSRLSKFIENGNL